MPPKFKKRKLNESKTEEVVFDPSARFDYLTGFHKRKVERAKHAQEAALRRAREEKIQQRKKLRQERKEDLDRHMREVNAMLPKKALADETDKDDDADQDDWNGIIDPEPVPIDHEDEYIDENKYTTVTVEEVDISRDGLTRLKATDVGEEKTSATTVGATEEKTKPQAKPKTRKSSAASSQDKTGKPKRKKKRDFRYENKADRKLSHLKVRAKKSKLAQARRDK